MVTKEDILKLAKLSQINVDDSEIDALVSKVSAVLEYASFLQNVKVDPSLTMPKHMNIMRVDQEVKFDSNIILSRAVQKEEDYFVVPVIVKN